MSKPLNLGIAGYGVTGSALYQWLIENTKHTVRIYDPPKGYHDDFLKFKPDAIFICVPVDTTESGTLDFGIIKPVLKQYQTLKKTPIYIRSTVLPKTTDHLCKLLKMRLYAMPEFLIERDHIKSMSTQDIICGAESEPTHYKEQEERLQNIFPGKKITLMSNREAELAKYAHNVFGAMKVNFFNLIAKYAETIGASYEHVKDGVLMTGFINNVCMSVPGPDGKFGFGGKCFPKDSIAFARELKRMGLQSGSIECMLFENAYYRLMREKWLKLPEIKFPPEYQPKF